MQYRTSFRSDRFEKMKVVFKLLVQSILIEIQFQGTLNVQTASLMKIAKPMITSFS